MIKFYDSRILHCHYFNTVEATVYHSLICSFLGNPFSSAALLHCPYHIIFIMSIVGISIETINPITLSSAHSRLASFLSYQQELALNAANNTTANNSSSM